jgi:chromosome partitioning protein
MKAGKVLEVLKGSRPTLLKKLVDYGIETEKTASGENIFRWKHITKLKYIEKFGDRPVKSFVLSVSQNKGGVGKTTAVINLATLFSYLGRVLLIDLDGQGNLSQFYNIFLTEEDNSVSNFIDDPESFSSAVQNVAENIDILPSSLNFDDWKEEAIEKSFDLYSLRKALKSVKGEYDFIIIDTPPSLDLSLKLAILAADYCIIPVEPQPFNISGVSNILNKIQKIIEKDNLIDLKVLGLFINMYENQVLSSELSEILKNRYDVFETKISKKVSVQQSQAMKQSIFEYDEKSPVSYDYFNLVFEILEKVL